MLAAAVRRSSTASAVSQRRTSLLSQVEEASESNGNSTQELVRSLTAKLNDEQGIAFPKRKSVRKRKDTAKFGEDNIFAKFGEENCPTTATSNKVVGGVQKAINIRKHWNSDVDIKRWQQALTDSSRFDKLLTDVRHRWHPDFGMHRAQLVQKHNALFRQRDDAEERNADEKAAAAKLRDLQDKFAPKKKAKQPKKVQIAFEGLSLFGRDRSTTMSSEVSFPSPVASRIQSSDMIADTSNQSSPPAEDGMVSEASPTGSIDGQHDQSRATQIMFFPSCPSSDERTRTRPATEGTLHLPKAELPRTFTLLLYRNGERTQKCGEAVFFQRVPKDMKETLRICGERCRPLVGPVEALLDSSLRPVKDVQDLRNGGIFLLKGKEALGPPVSFFQRGEPQGGSMRHLVQFQRHNNSSPSMCSRSASQLDLPQDAADSVRSYFAKAHSETYLPVVGGPPASGGRSCGGRSWSETSSSQRDDPMRATWTVDDNISWRMSYGGLVNNVKHRDYSLWPSILPTSSRSDRMRITR